VRTLSFHDWREVRQSGRPLHLEVLALNDARLHSHAAGLAGQRAFASVIMVAAGAQDALPHARAALADPDVRAAASALPGRLLIRLMAADGWPLRRQMARLLTALRGKPLPRVWQI
jgi:urease accessory protein